MFLAERHRKCHTIDFYRNTIGARVDSFISFSWYPYYPDFSMKTSPRSDVVLETQTESSSKRLVVRSLINDFRIRLTCDETSDSFPFDGFECKFRFRISVGGRFNFTILPSSSCGKEHMFKERHGDFDLVQRNLKFEVLNLQRTAIYAFKFVRNRSRLMWASFCGSKDCIWFTLLVN